MEITNQLKLKYFYQDTVPSIHEFSHSLILEFSHSQIPSSS